MATAELIAEMDGEIAAGPTFNSATPAETFNECPPERPSAAPTCHGPQAPDHGNPLEVVVISPLATDIRVPLAIAAMCRDPGSNRGPSDLRSGALPTVLSRLADAPANLG